MTTKWTKGPWRVGPYYKHEVVSHDGVICCAPIETEQTRANAQLIASAPALYEQLDRISNAVLYAWANEKNIGRVEYAARKQMVEQVEAALRQARGEKGDNNVDTK